MPTVSRRTFITGLGGIAALGSGAADAATQATELIVDQRPDGITVRFRNSRCVQPVNFGLPRMYWSSTTDPQATSVRMRVTDKTEPEAPDGEVRRSVVIEFLKASFAGTPDFRATFTLKLVGPDCRIGLTTTGWPRSGATHFAPIDLVAFCEGQPLTANLSGTEAPALVKGLFGPRLRYLGNGRLSFGRDLIWSLAGATPQAFETDPELGRRKPNERVFFPALRFAPVAPAAGPFDADILARAFPKDAAAPVEGAGVSSNAALSGVSDGALAGGSALSLGQLGEDEVTATQLRLDSVAFQRIAGRAEVLSAISGDFLIGIGSSARSEGPFATVDGRIYRYGSGGRSGLARLPLASKPFEVSTTHGRFVVEAPDPIVPEPGGAKRRPGIALSTIDGRLESFVVSALVRQAFVPFPVSANETGRSFFSRMDFTGAACSFVLAGLDTPTSWSAGSVVRIGARAAEGADPVRLRLDQAKLRVVRPDDLLSLTFTFSGLALICRAGEAEVVPLAEGQCGAHLAQSVNAARGGGAERGPAFRTGAAVDDRPMMVVDFPPQHVAERAYYRQVDDGQDPPDVALTQTDIASLQHAFSILDGYRRGRPFGLEDRIAARRAIQCAKIARARHNANQARKAAEAAGTADRQAADAVEVAEKAESAFRSFSELFDANAPMQAGARAWPEDQTIYAGSEWLDLDVRRFARRLAAELPTDINKKAESRLSVAVPGSGLQQQTRGSLPADPKDRDYAVWVQAYDTWGERLFGGLPRYCGPQTVEALLQTRQLGDAELAMLLARIDADLADSEAFEPDVATPARLSGPTRLAFRINCDDVEGGGRFPFTLERLTDWSRFDLAVVRRAEKLLDFDGSGRLPPRWARSEILDASAMLAHQGIEPATGLLARLNGGRGTMAQRMAQVVAAAKVEPGPFETAIELPFRLTLSPAQDARWRTPRLFAGSCRPVPLWQAALEEDTSRASLRAVWSQDFSPDIFLDGDSPPAHGPWAPWDQPASDGDGSAPHATTRFRASLDAGDRHELVALTSLYGLPVLGSRGVDNRLVPEGDQIEPPTGYRLRGLGDDSDAIYSPRPLAVDELALSALGGSLTLDTHFAPPAAPHVRGNQPPFQALNIQQWRHTAVLGRDVSVQVVYKGFLFPFGHRVSYVKATERRFMRHPTGGPVAYLIQRKFLQVGHPRKAYPALGQANEGRALPPRLVNILTRRTRDLVDPEDQVSTGRPKEDGQNGVETPNTPGREDRNGTVSFYLDDGSKLPGLVFWPRTGAGADANVRFEMQFDDAGGSISMPLLFVDNTAAHDPRTLRALTTYYNTLPPALRNCDHHGMPRRYAAESKAGEATFETLQWLLQAEGGPASDGTVAKLPGNSDFSFTAPLEGANQPPFYPKLETCRIRLNQIGRLTGSAAPEVTARYYPNYVDNGFQPAGTAYKNDAGVFLLITPDDGTTLPAMQFGHAGDRVAGFARPEHRIAALSLRGPIGSPEPYQAALPPKTDPTGPSVTVGSKVSEDVNFSSFDPQSFFKGFGKLLGIMDIGDVIRLSAGLAGMPQLSETIDYASDQSWSFVRETVLQPLDSLLVALDRTLSSIAAAPGGQDAPPIALLMPDLEKAKGSLRESVALALDAEQPSLEVQARLISRVYENARSFINALQRLASNPIGQLQISLRNNLNGYIRSLVGMDVEGLADLKSDIDKRLYEFVRRLDLLRSAVDLGWSKWKIIWIVGLARRHVGDEIIAPINDQETNVILNSKADIKSSVIEILKNRIEYQASQYGFGQTIADELYDVLRSVPDGPLLQTLNEPIARLIKARAAIEDASKALVAKVDATATAEAISALTPLLQGALDLLQAGAPLTKGFCQNVVDATSSLVELVGLAGSETKKAVESVVACLDDPNACAPTLLPPGGVGGKLLLALKDLPAIGDGATVAWANALRNDLRRELSALTDTMESLRSLAPLSDKDDAEKACGKLDVAALRTYLKPVPRYLELRFEVVVQAEAIIARLFTAIGPLTKAVEADKNLALGQAAARFILRSISALGDLLLYRSKNEIDGITSTIGKLGITIDVVLPDLTPTFEAIDKQVEKVGKATDPAMLVSQLEAVAGATLLNQLADLEKALQLIFRGARRIALEGSGLALDAVLLLRTPLERALEVVLAIYTNAESALSKSNRKLDETLNEVARIPGLGLAIAPLATQLRTALDTKGNSSFKADETALSSARTALSNFDSTKLNLDKLADARTKLDTAIYRLLSPDNAIASAAMALTGIGRAVLKGDIAKLIDVDAPRREIEALIRDLIPHKATMAYKLDTELQPFADIFIPDQNRGAGRLSIETTAVVELLNQDQLPQTTVAGTLDPFNIHLFGSNFDVVLLKFKAASFGTKPGSGFRFSVDLEAVELGAMVEFLKELQSYLTPSDGNGFYLRQADGVPGIEVGYGLNLGTISLGPVSFINVGLNAGCRLPFDSSEALFTISLSRPDAPFLISAGIYGGGGYLGLIANGRKIVGFEASFEFGGVSAFSFGPLTGIGRLTTGIFVRKLGDVTTIEGFFFCGGSARIACFGISASLSVRISMQPGGAMAGSAVFTFSFSIGFAHLDFHITVLKTQPKLGGQTAMGPEIGPDFGAPGRIRLAAADEALARDLSAARPVRRIKDGPRVHAETLSPNRDWRRYRSYFAHDLTPLEAE